MMNIDITDFLREHDAMEFSASVAELGQNAGPMTWRNANRAAASTRWLKTSDDREEARAFFRSFGAWEDDEIDQWTNDELTALLIQFIAGDWRKAGEPDTDSEWLGYFEAAECGQAPSSLYRDEAGRIFWSGE